MAGFKRNRRFVIFDGPQQHGGPGTRYFSHGDTSTECKYKAAKFFTAPDATEFARRNNIVLGALQ